ncbi:hypothetical protein [Azospirillum sp.]|uniref:hypothetical protein n=1 Tax=Azospirillum sp. TaxID=34012 RepID=UPI003D733A97
MRGMRGVAVAALAAALAFGTPPARAKDSVTVAFTGPLTGGRTGHPRRPGRRRGPLGRSRY